MKRLLVVIAVMSALLIIPISPFNKVSADLAPFPPCASNYSRSNPCNNPYNPSPTKCSGFINCLDLKTLPTWELYLINLGIETFVATIFVILFKKSKRLILAVVIVNLISWPILYTQILHHGSVGFLFVAEAAVWLFEAAGIYLICRKQTTPLLASVLSLLTNSVSLTAGLLFFH